MPSWFSRLSSFLGSSSGASPSKSAAHGGHGNGHGSHGPYGYGYNNKGSGAKWAGGLAYSGRPIHLDHHALLINARNACNDTLQARAIVERFADVVVDSGIKIAPTPEAELLGITPEQAEEWGGRVGRRYDLFMGSKQAHVSETMTGYQAQRLYEIFQHRDNDIFVRLHYGVSPGSISNLQFSFIDPTQLRSAAYTSTDGFNDGYLDGIKRDANGKETDYKVWIKKDKSSGNFEYDHVEIPAVGASGRRHMLHGFSPEYAGQGRGYSRLSHAIQELENLTDFTSATIKKAINQANITMIVEPSKDEDAESPFENIEEFHIGQASAEFGSNPTPSAGAVDVGDLQSVDYCPIPEADLRAPGSTGVFNLRKGSKMTPFQNSAPGDSFDSFVDSFTAYLAASMNMPIEVLLMRFNSNYSASRGALILFWRVAWIWRHEMDSDFLMPLYEAWLSEEIAAGREQAPGWSDPILRAAWLSHDLVASPIPNIDDLKTAKANKQNLQMNATDLDRVSRETNGSNGKANRGKLSRQVDELVPMPFGGGRDG